MAAPTASATLHLAEGTGTRSFVAQATSAGDWLVVAVLVQDDNTGTFPVSEATLGTFPSVGGTAGDTGTGTGTRARILWTAVKDVAGGTRTVTITPSVGTRSYRGWLTVASGSRGVGAVAGVKTAQSISLPRAGYDSMLLMAVVDWSTGAVGTPQWIPGGATVVSQQGTNATYVLGRWNASGVQGTAATGDNGTVYTTPAVAVVEVLGTGDGPAGGGEGPYPVPLALPLLTYDATSQPAVYPMRPYQRRFQWTTQPWLNSEDVQQQAVAGPPVYPLGHPVWARALPTRGGLAATRDGTYAGTGPSVRPAVGPVRAQSAAVRGGRTAGRTGTLVAAAPQSGPPVRPADSPVQARRQPARGGAAAGRDGTFAGVGPAVESARGPVAAARAPQRGGRVASRAGTFTAQAPTSGSPVAALDHPVQARQPAPGGGRVFRTAARVNPTGWLGGVSTDTGGVSLATLTLTDPGWPAGSLGVLVVGFAVSVTNEVVTISAASGAGNNWTLTTPQVAANNEGFAVLHRVKGAGDSATVTVTLASTRIACAGVGWWAGRADVGAVGVLGNRAGTSQSTTTAPGVGTVAGRTVALAYVERTVAAGTTANLDLGTVRLYREDASAGACSVLLGDLTAASGTSGGVTATYSGAGSGNGIGLQVELLSVAAAVALPGRPVRTRPAPVRGGRVLARAGTLTAGAPQAGPAAGPPDHPVAARRGPTRGGCVTNRAGVYAGTGPPVAALRQPSNRGRQAPPPRGRVGSQRGVRQNSGPPARSPTRPVRAMLPGPFRTGRAVTTLLPAAPTVVLLGSGRGTTEAGPGSGRTSAVNLSSATTAGSPASTEAGPGQSRTEASWQSSSVTGRA